MGGFFWGGGIQNLFNDLNSLLTFLITLKGIPIFPHTDHVCVYIYIYIRGAFNKFPDFFRMGI